MTSESQEQILVLGLGKSGFAAAELAASRGAAVTVLDEGGSPELRDRGEQLRRRGVDTRLEWNEDTWSEVAPELVVISPGIPPDSFLGRIAQSSSCPVVGEIEYGYRYCSCPILAVTGTNGKTTTVELLVHVLTHAGYSVLAAGNTGRPLSDAAARSSDLDFLIVEVSSFQLEHIVDFAPLAGAILNVTPDHLDRYPSFSAYRQTKFRLATALNSPRDLVICEDLTGTPEFQDSCQCDDAIPILFAPSESLVADFFLGDDGVLYERVEGTCVALLDQAALRLSGRHNAANVLAALALAKIAGIAPAELVPHLRTFVPSAHRLELVTVHRGIRIINDSKATNADAMAKAILTCAEQGGAGGILLIAGGVAKGQDFDSQAPVVARHVKDVFLVGRCRERLAKQWNHVVSCKMFVSLAAAVDAALDSADSGDTVLLSPGCASHDMFSDYADRGREFCALVRRRVGE
ncbi:MAG: UDP-N-acetylmuramoyl-L-alanine--D-glutamate ligase [Lentisphaerae bacterium]|mgnify:CR=1 FL=1|nr:UDP-N-acetylmuramoyl-L-alanine--D-glutamate ligase [Lentisphaerota bacterium]MBT4819047.1 UDP-N-acetylmuramoyl-L-alanine--D-glutamate ligase [Lentisphaerota bacterium]MBT5612311.1 UDP-N-acetylmuramoyl-L-alanine--D-glutamate ligase [Lentisphaerota bacterium]MBT7060711.1 UDP-N-acetylmuramoyl-L-alanine--D-glutamate ligase [Lentisphaerota bacterium]MBT7845290.1 UDP-N-acetylmuramoyl-L-alanine--D-glutamate ligase [Lentisphaerota bacterium]